MQLRAFRLARLGASRLCAGFHRPSAGAGRAELPCLSAYGKEAGMLTLTSSAFHDHHGIPKHFTCEGEEVSPPLTWSGAPAGTKSFALIVEDPDAPDPAAPQRVFGHWVLYNIPASVNLL